MDPGPFQTAWCEAHFNQDRLQEEVLLSWLEALLLPSYRLLLWLEVREEEVLLILHSPLVFCSHLDCHFVLTWLKCPLLKGAERRELEAGIGRVQPEELELVLLSALVSGLEIELELDRMAWELRCSGGCFASLG